MEDGGPTAEEMNHNHSELILCRSELGVFYNMESMCCFCSFPTDTKASLDKRG